MLDLRKKIDQELKQATINKEEQKVSTLRMLKAAFYNKEISLRKGKDVSLSDKQLTEIIASEIKKRKDAIEAYQQGNRDDLAKKEKQEIEILEKYLPEQLTDAELEKIVKEVVDSLDEVSFKDMGKVMAQVMPKVQGKAEGNRVSQIVKKVLA